MKSMSQIVLWIRRELFGLIPNDNPYTEIVEQNFQIASESNLF